MNEMAMTLLVTVGIASFVGVIAMSFGLGWVLGRGNERVAVRSAYRLVSKAVWPLGESGMVLNLARKRIVCPPGDFPPESVTVAFADHTVVLRPAAVLIGDAEQSKLDAPIGGGAGESEIE